MVNTIEKIKQMKIVPIITIHRIKDVIPVIQALIRGGLPVAEIMFRTDLAGEAINIASRTFPDLLLGAGTILTPDQADEAYAHGAQFMVTPGFNPRVVDHCLDRNIPIIPGLNSPTQIEQALERGIDHVKFFPAEASGGLPFINAIATPYGSVRFMATGGINNTNLKHYLSNPFIFACGGSWIVKKELITESRFDDITRIVKETVESVQEL
jgi:2-dehydro-3-deoxyphosphogluconate aldolase/(4S)-4-hydroxy-2-oxoglutarate aldolase